MTIPNSSSVSEMIMPRRPYQMTDRHKEMGIRYRLNGALFNTRSEQPPSYPYTKKVKKKTI